MVWTRDIDPVAAFGRVRTMARIHAVGTSLNAVHVRLCNLLEKRRLTGAAAAIAKLASGFVSGNRQPLQVLLYSDMQGQRLVMDRIRDTKPNVVYLDSIRTAPLVPRIRDVAPECRIVVDLDDLMSRRFEIACEMRLPMSLGYLSSYLPAWVTGRFERSRIVRTVMAYEGSALKVAENRLLSQADHLVLVSAVEAALLSGRLSESRAAVHAIPPPADQTMEDPFVAEPFRFVFAGSDRLVQNRLTIEHLLARWSSLRPQTPLHIYGRMHYRYESPPNVTFHGFVEDLGKAVRGGILLAPSFVPGGIKTKVLDGFAHGCAVVGNSNTFEGLGLSAYPLVLDAQELFDMLITNPAKFTTELHVAANIGRDLALGRLSGRRFVDSWRALLALSGDAE
jgi:hypothetical protein